MQSLMQSKKTIACTLRSIRAAFFSSTHLCTRTEPQLVHECLHETYPQAFFEQAVLRVLAELNTNEYTHNMSARTTTRNFPSSLYQAVPHMHVRVWICVRVHPQGHK